MGKVVLGSDDAERTGAQAVRHDRRTLGDEGAGALHVLPLDLLRGGRVAAARSRQHARGHALDDVPEEAAWDLARADRLARSRDGPARVVAEHDDERAVQDSATPNSSDPNTLGSTTCPAVRTTKRSPRPWSKMISAATRVGTAEEDGEGVLLEGDPIPEVHILVRVGPFVGDEPRCFPAASTRQASFGVRGAFMSRLPLDHVEDAISAPLGDGRASEDAGVRRGPPLRSRPGWVRRRRRDAR